MDLTKTDKSQFLGKLESLVRTADQLRQHKDTPLDVTFSDILKEQFQVSTTEFYNDLGINPNADTINNLMTYSNVDVRWIIPEIIRDAIRLGYRKAPIWPNIVAAEEQMAGLKAIMPHINMSDATPRRVGEAETIPLGNISYGSKSFDVYKIGRGISMSYEVMQYSTLNVVSLFLQDLGIKFGHAMDTLAIDTLINGEQADGSESAPVIGTETATKAYIDFLRVWVRLGRMGRNPNTIIGGESAAIETLDLNEFKLKQDSGSPVALLDVKTPVPNRSNYFVHGLIPSKKELILDPKAALLKFNVRPLLVESEKIVANQTTASYATITTGFAKLFRDAVVILDNNQLFSNTPWPSYMDVDALENVTIE